MAASASYAAKKGLLVVCSAGNSGMDEWKKITPPADAEDILTINSGMDEWKKITPPADAEDILTIGAIDNMGVNAAFSSIGNTADGRIKPDVMAMGVHSAVVGVDGGTAFANGTSFASPCQWYFFCVAYFLRTGGLFVAGMSLAYGTAAHSGST